MSELEYLLIPNQYAQSLGGLEWSPTCDAIADVDGNTVVMAPALAQFLEGAGARDRLVHFGFVLHFMHHLLAGDSRVSRAWKTAHGSMRNAGALFAELTHALPRHPGSLDVRKLCGLIRKQTELGELHFISRSAVTPPLTPDGFAAHLVRVLDGLTDSDVAHWFRHGRGPRVDGDAPPVELPSAPPRTLGGELEDALKRKRLAGVAPFVDQMISALTLPPRRVMISELPVGGYSSVTNRGHPDQILPGEFAVDELEFLRRYAENELLYWQREEPQSQVREDLVVLCDQGVRTWGEPRLALTAAAVALGKRAEQRGKQVKFASTGNQGEPVAEEVALLLESSDLSPNPGLALERTLEEPCFEHRDIVLLTHPRNLLEEDVRSAARRLAPNVRLFALTVDEEGAAELSELRRGETVSIRKFQLVKPRKEREPAAEAAPDQPFKGPVEPVPFPFRFGLIGAGGALAMDWKGRYLFAASHGGLLHVWDLERDTQELLPRPVQDGQALKNVRKIIGVQGGVVVAYEHGTLSCMAHIDMVSRTMAVTAPSVANAQVMETAYVPEHHSVLLTAAGTSQVWALDGRSTPPGQVAQSKSVKPLRVVQQPAGRPLEDPGESNVLVYQRREGKLALLTEDTLWKAYQPRSDGGLLLKDATVIEAAHGGGTLAVRVHRQGRETVLLYTGPEWKFFGEYNAQTGVTGLAVSEDGARVAYRSKGAGVTCFELRDSAERLLTASAAKHHSSLAVAVGAGWMTCYGGKFTHLLRWDRERLEIAFLQGQKSISDFISRRQDAAALNPRAVHLRPGRVAPCLYDEQRFTHYGYSPDGLLVVADTMGQVSVFNGSEKLIAMFFIYRGTVAGWLPDGTRYGPASITGGPTTPDALGRIGRALRKAGVD